MRRVEMGRLKLLVAVLLGIAPIACLSPMDPDKIPLASVRVAVGENGLNTDTIQVRGTMRVQARAVAREGFDAGVTQFRYASSNTAVATIDSLGTVRGVAPGTVTITVTTPSGVSGTATVVVVPTTIAYTIPVGGVPGAIAFSPDYTRSYVTVGRDSLVILDALAFLRLASLDLGLATAGVASTGQNIYVTHPDDDSVSIVSAATKQLTGRLAIPGSPRGIVARGSRAWVTATDGQQVIAIDDDGSTSAVDVEGKPRDISVSGDGRRLFVTTQVAQGWKLLVLDAETLETAGSVTLPGAPGDLAANDDGSTAYVTLPQASRLQVVNADANATLTLGASLTGPANAGGVALRSLGVPSLVLSGSGAMVIDAQQFIAGDLIAGAGGGRVAIRPDGLFAFLASPSLRSIQVIGL
ncbi:MAG: hypothetical protein JWO05_3362 [Gemmatimonadetes bacterium]|nr:hypothetical protein [Gemmatimonadota bacterium]